MSIVFIKIIKFLSLVTVIRCEVTPIVLWHGMGDTCCSPTSLGAVYYHVCVCVKNKLKLNFLPHEIGRFKKTLEEEIPGVYVLSLKITGDSSSGNYDSSYFIHPNQQVILRFY